MEFNDRRPQLEVRDEDYETPVTRSSLTDANRRIREATLPTRQDDEASHINWSTQKRYRERKAGRDLDYTNIAEYMRLMTGA